MKIMEGGSFFLYGRKKNLLSKKVVGGMTPHAAPPPPPAFAGHELPRRFRSTNADDRKLCVDVSSLNREQNAHYRKVSDPGAARSPREVLLGVKFFGDHTLFHLETPILSIGARLQYNEK